VEFKFVFKFFVVVMVVVVVVIDVVDVIVVFRESAFPRGKPRLRHVRHVRHIELLEGQTSWTSPGQ
jgi:hypothetical protein